MDRRSFLSFLAPLAAVSLAVSSPYALAGRIRRRVRHRVRVRRRIRRRSFTRVMFGRPFWVVPVGLAVGWELMHENRVVVVKEIKVVERDGKRSEVAVVQDESGKRDEVEFVREDNADNSANLPGSVLPKGDTSTPAVESEEDVDE